MFEALPLTNATVFALLCGGATDRVAAVAWLFLMAQE